MAAVPEGLEQQGRPRDARALAVRETVVDTIAGASFVAAAVAIAVLGDSDLAWRWNVGVALVVAFAITVRARFDIGTGYAPPTQLVFVPMVFLAPPQYAPLIALAGWVLGRLPDLARRETHASRLLVVPGNCWFALGPAIVLTAAGAAGPDWGDWPLYVLALAAQFAGDIVSSVVRDRAIYGVAPEIELKVLAYVWSIDVALSPIGLLAAFASQDARFAFLAILPLVGILVVFSHERSRRFQAELASTRAREALIAGASHELQTPLAVISGIVDSLARSPSLTTERRTASYETLQRQTAHLRHLVSQFVDYARLKAGQELLISIRPVEAASTVQAVATLWESSGVETDVETEEVSVLADPARLHSVLMSLVANAVKHGPPEGPVALACRREGNRAIIEVSDRGPGVPEDRIEAVFDDLDPGVDRTEGSGIGLFLAREALRAQGGDVRLRNRPGGGLTATIYLPVSPR